MEEAEKYLDPVRNIYLLRVRQGKYVATKNGPQNADLLKTLESILATFEFYDFIGVCHGESCIHAGGLLLKNASRENQIRALM